MTNKWNYALVALALVSVWGCGSQESVPASKEKEVTLDSQKSRISYTIGLNIGRDFVNQEMDIDADVLLAGLQDAMAQKEPRMTEDEMAAEVQSFQQDMQAKAEAKMKALAEKNLEEGKAFLAENASKEGVMVTESGLQYKIIEAGTGDAPTESDTVTVHYKGTLIDGTQFDSSYDRGQPATFPVGGVIPGWTEALQLMKPGAKFQIYIPAELAYGERGAGQDIGPNATLIFDVELIEVGAEGN
ncbi:MAG: FKBP-type peptidyl-prolyl cis-trans isomerase [Deltaproteobacteria bacterium]|jgi:FKBP-type peptidyl-prolyl cis-trans isomerase|nr:FKBP-type peptidyl-prolyl cis-trans isomerase [Deltaproteobacteria bacterium]MBW2477426.1 FKBP-type peptidyl-prolyl cis-trans isomerase [Deltaproteobacteria bacterium]MBW2519915.1 FKBP-type peptidyl-prolyl cis-trans isomerase [Deltaproteobacteria bacterium]